MRTLQPRKKSFLFARLAHVPVWFVFLAAGLGLDGTGQPMMIAVALLALLVPVGLTVWAALVAYDKERYEIYADHLVRRSGTVFSDDRAELDLSNVTHIRLRLPWIQHMLYGTGDIRVESAGSANSEITFLSVHDAEQVYADLQDLLRDNGFSLAKTTRRFEGSPTTVGAALESFNKRLVPLLATAVFGGLTVGGSLVDAEVPYAMLITALIMTVLTVLALASSILHFQDLRRRNYTVFEDAVEYTEGFLTCDNAVIPFENIADASVNRSLVDQVLGLYDVKISCQGSGSEITFLKLAEGEALQQTIRELVREASGRPQPAPSRAAAQPEAEAATPSRAAKRSSRPVIAEAEAWTANLTMNMMRAVAPGALGLIVPPIGVLAIIGLGIRARFTTFTVDATSVSSKFSFINVVEQQFAYDKVTGVQIMRSPWDAMFGTVSVEIWSIGSSRPMRLSHIDEDAIDLDALLRQCGIPSSDGAEAELEQEMTPRAWLIQNLPIYTILLLTALVPLVLTPFLGLVLVPILGLLGVVMLLAAIGAYDVALFRSQRMCVHADHVTMQSGVWVKTQTFVRHDNIKKVESTRIPTTDQGTLTLYVAGERLVQQNQQQQNGQQTTLLPYTISARYMTGIEDKVDAMDALLLGKIQPSEVGGSHPQGEDVQRVVCPAVANRLLVFALVPPLWLFIPWMVWSIRVQSYAIESDRVVHMAGIFFRTKTSVLLDRIDAMQQNQGMLGKMFSNGSVTLLTAGSSSPDLVISDVPDHAAVYGLLRKREA